MIRLAENKDVQQIMGIVKVIIAEMVRDENFQWDETYPSDEKFLEDIHHGNLYVDESKNGDIRGFICVDYNEPEEYEGLNWSSENKALVIHRMAVSSKYRGQGIAVKLMTYAEKLAMSLQCSCIHTDTYSSNKPMNALFKKLGYQFVGTIYMIRKPLVFNCYEKNMQ